MKRPTITDLFILLFAPFIFLFIKGRRMAGIVILLTLTFAFSGCFKNYFKTKTLTISDSSVTALKNADKYFVVHLKNGFYNLRNITLNGNTIEGSVQALAPEREKFVMANNPAAKTYKSRDKSLLFSEVHLYAQDESATESSHVSIPLTSVSQIIVYEKDTGKTVASYLLGGVGIYLGVTALVGLILLATCNCPQVYTFDGDQYNFKSGVFSGAIYSSIEKTDYLPLDNIQSINGKYHFKLANNQQEVQFINQVQLISAEHSNSTNVLLDRKGTPYTYGNNLSRGRIENLSGPVEEVLQNKDGKVYMFEQQSDGKSLFGSVILNFTPTDDNGEGKLIVHAKNSSWSGYIFDEFSSLFGSKYQSWVSRQDNAKREVIEKWQQEQALPLTVYVETDNGWTFADYFPFTGNTAGRDMIMKLKLPKDKKNVRVKIECAHMFWELDYAAMDFSKDEPVKITQVAADVAKANDAIKLAELAAKDKSYVALKEDEALTVEFTQPSPVTGKTQSIFLSATGYYHSTKEYTGKTETAALYQFKKKGAFNRFSQIKYSQAKEALAKGISLPIAPINE